MLTPDDCRVGCDPGVASADTFRRPFIPSDRPLLAAALATARDVRAVRNSQTTPTPDVWTQLQALPIGARVRITLTNGTEIEGRLVQATAESVVLNMNEVKRGQFAMRAGMTLADNHTFGRTDISRLRIERGWASRHPVLTAVTIGAGAVGALVVIAALNGFGAY